MRKMNGPLKRMALAVLMAASGTALAVEQTPDVKPQLQIQPAEHVSGASAAQILAATHAGPRIVAVGDHGVVLLSDDAGKTYRQATTVPISSTLTAVSFADARTGWAVGHWGAIVKTTDGGETWTLQRSDTSVDQPLFSVYFRDSREGWAVGLWSLMLHTSDGGMTWSTVKLPAPPGQKKADRNLYAIFANPKGDLFVACEQGRVLRSTDGGNTWTYAETGYAGSFWTGVALKDGVLLVGGLRGAIYRSPDGGEHWQSVQTPFGSAITALIQRLDGSVTAIGLNGTLLSSRDDGVSFTHQTREDRAELTAQVEAPDGTLVLFSEHGQVKN